MSDSDHDITSSDELSSDTENISNTKSKDKIYNSQAILQKLKEIKYENVSWMEMPVVNSGFVHKDVNPEDDFEREVSFYKQTIAGCQEARVRLETASIEYKRPDDYFAEMLKSDSHMAKVRQSLLDQQKRIEAVEERRRQRELQRFGKQVQVEKEQTRAKQKKSEVEGLKKWRKDQKRSTAKSGGGKEQKDIDTILAEAKEGANKPKSTPKKNLKRKRKDALYGFGGKQKRAKSNTADSAADFTSFSVNRNRSVDSDLHPLIPKFARSNGPKRRTSRPPKKLRKISR